MKIPRLLIAGTHSGVGKTTVTAGLIRLFARQGLKVQPFKAGPDYIDPGYHSAVAGRVCRNLDSWMVPSRRLPELFQRACKGSDLAVIEGVMGLYDGASATGDAGSTAELAKLLDCPVLLVLDAAAVSRSAAAVVRGFRDMDRKVRIAGCVVNRISGPGHYRLVKEGIERLAGVPVVGWLPKDPQIHLPERHLGLVPAVERENLASLMKRLERLVAANFDLPAIRRIANSAPSVRPEPVEGRTIHASTKLSMNGEIPIAVARDEAFHFYYPENLELLEDLGAEIAPFSPLKDRRLPRGTAALYLGGGFPEVFAPGLARNLRMKEEIRRAVLSGLPTYAECGGLMYLARSISSVGGRRYPMAGLIPADVRMTDRLQNFGYQEVRSKGANLLARAGEKARGHEFHHSVLERWVPRLTEAAPSSLPRKCRGAGAPRPAYEVRARQELAGRARRGGAARLEGYADGSLLASYVHLHFWSQPRWAERFVQSARAFKQN